MCLFYIIVTALANINCVLTAAEQHLLNFLYGLFHLFLMYNIAHIVNEESASEPWLVWPWNWSLSASFGNQVMWNSLCTFSRETLGVTFLINLREIMWPSCLLRGNSVMNFFNFNFFIYSLWNHVHFIRFSNLLANYYV